MYYLPTNAICKLHLSEQHLYGAKRLSKTLHRNNTTAEETDYEKGYLNNSGGYYNVFHNGKLVEQYGGYKESGFLEEYFGENVGEAVNMPEKLKTFQIEEIKKTYENIYGGQ